MLDYKRIARLEAENETALIAIRSAKKLFDEEIEALRSENEKFLEIMEEMVKFLGSINKKNFSIYEAIKYCEIMKNACAALAKASGDPVNDIVNDRVNKEAKK